MCSRLMTVDKVGQNKCNGNFSNINYQIIEL